MNTNVPGLRSWDLSSEEDSLELMATLEDTYGFQMLLGFAEVHGLESIVKFLSATKDDILAADDALISQKIFKSHMIQSDVHKCDSIWWYLSAEMQRKIKDASSASSSAQASNLFSRLISEARIEILEYARLHLFRRFKMSGLWRPHISHHKTGQLKKLGYLVWTERQVTLTPDSLIYSRHSTKGRVVPKIVALRNVQSVRIDRKCPTMFVMSVETENGGVQELKWDAKGRREAASWVKCIEHARFGHKRDDETFTEFSVTVLGDRLGDGATKSTSESSSSSGHVDDCRHSILGFEPGRLQRSLKGCKTYSSVAASVAPGSVMDLGGVHVGDVICAVDDWDARDAPYELVVRRLNEGAEGLRGSRSTLRIRFRRFHRDATRQMTAAQSFAMQRATHDARDQRRQFRDEFDAIHSLVSQLGFVRTSAGASKSCGMLLYVFDEASRAWCLNKIALASDGTHLICVPVRNDSSLRAKFERETARLAREQAFLKDFATSRKDEVSPHASVLSASDTKAVESLGSLPDVVSSPLQWLDYWFRVATMDAKGRRSECMSRRRFEYLFAPLKPSADGRVGLRSTRDERDTIFANISRGSESAHTGSSLDRRFCRPSALSLDAWRRWLLPAVRALGATNESDGAPGRLRKHWSFGFGMSVSKRLTEKSPTRLNVRYDLDGRLGIKFDDSLTIVSVSPWARTHGLRTGQRIVACAEQPVLTNKALRDALPKDKTTTFQLDVVIDGDDDGNLHSGSSDPQASASMSPRRMRRSHTATYSTRSPSFTTLPRHFGACISCKGAFTSRSLMCCKSGAIFCGSCASVYLEAATKEDALTGKDNMVRIGKNVSTKLKETSERLAYLTVHRLLRMHIGGFALVSRWSRRINALCAREEARQCLGKMMFREKEPMILETRVYLHLSHALMRDDDEKMGTKKSAPSETDRVALGRRVPLSTIIDICRGSEAVSGDSTALMSVHGAPGTLPAFVPKPCRGLTFTLVTRNVGRRGKESDANTLTSLISKDRGHRESSLQCLYPALESTAESDDAELDALVRRFQLLLHWSRRMDLRDDLNQSTGMGNSRSVAASKVEPNDDAATKMATHSLDTPCTPLERILNATSPTLSSSTTSLGDGIDRMLTSTVLGARIFVGSWNQGAKDPFADAFSSSDGGRTDDRLKTSAQRRVRRVLDNFVPSDQEFDVYVIGLQEGVSENTFKAIEAHLADKDVVRLLPSKTDDTSPPARDISGSNRKGDADDFVDRIYGRGDGSLMFPKFTGIAVYVRRALLSTGEVSLVSSGAQRIGSTGSKGGVALLMRILGSSVAFVNCHLAANSGEKRIKNYRKIAAELGPKLGLSDFELTEQFRHVVWMGDVNYRVVGINEERVLRHISEGSLRALYAADGLVRHQELGVAWELFREPPMASNFFPTYKKYEDRDPKGVDYGDPKWPWKIYRISYKEPIYKGGKFKARVPGWCDRILYYPRVSNSIVSTLEPELRSVHDDASSKTNRTTKQSSYESVNEGECMSISDHSPVRAVLRLRVLQPAPGHRVQSSTTRLEFSNVSLRIESSIEEHATTQSVTPSKVLVVFPAPHDSRETSSRYDVVKVLWNPSAESKCRIQSTGRTAFQFQRVLLKIFVGDEAIGQCCVELENLEEGRLNAFKRSIVRNGVYVKGDDGSRTCLHGDVHLRHDAREHFLSS